MLLDIIKIPRVIEMCSLYFPSISVRLRKLNRSFADWLNEDRLSIILPQTFDELDLAHHNPFLICQQGIYEALWLMLLRGLDARVVDQVSFYV